MGLPFVVTRRGTDVWSHEADELPSDLPWLGAVPVLLWQAEVSLCSKAESFWFKERNRARLLDVRWLDPASMKPKWDSKNGLVGFTRRIGTQSIALAPEDVVYCFLPGLRETEPGTPPAEVAAMAAGVIYNADQFISGFFKRGAIKATLLAVPQNTSDDERKRLKSWWQRVVEGVSGAWSAHVVQSGAIEAVQIGEGLESLSNATLTQEKREDILSALGVPHSLVMANAANYATSQQDELNFYTHTILPQAKIIERQLNEQLFEPLGMQWKFKPQELSLFQEDEEQRAQSLQALTNAGVPLALAMEMLGFQLPDGWDFSDLEEPEPEPMTVLPPQPPRQLTDEQAVEVRRFKTWAGRRKNPDPAQFKSDLLTDADKAAILAGVEVGDATDAPFLAAGWEDYP
jgi:HK97 family phage portal protein